MAQNKLTYNDRRRTMHFAVFFEMSPNNVSLQYTYPFTFDYKFFIFGKKESGDWWWTKNKRIRKVRMF